MNRRHTRFIRLQPEVIERSFTDALRELWREPPPTNKFQNTTVVHFPSVGRGNPAYYLYVQIKKEEDGTRIDYWQKHTRPELRIATWVFIIGASTYFYATGSITEYLQILLVLLGLGLYTLFPISIQPRTRELVDYAFSHRT
jgi:hypothetical protein